MMVKWSAVCSAPLMADLRAESRAFETAYQSENTRADTRDGGSAVERARLRATSLACVMVSRRAASRVALTVAEKVTE